MKTYKIPTTWSMASEVEIEANSLEEAITKVRSSDYNNSKENDMAEYVADSWEIQYEFIDDTYLEEN